MLYLRLMVFATAALSMLLCSCAENGSKGVSKVPSEATQGEMGLVTLRLLKSKEGGVVIWIRNNSTIQCAIQRHGELIGDMEFEREAGPGKFEPIPRASPPGTQIDYRELADSDWCSLGLEDGVSWMLAEDLTGNLKVGDNVKIHWKHPLSVPPKMQVSAKVFPERDRTVTAFVESMPPSLDIEK